MTTARDRAIEALAWFADAIVCGRPAMHNAAKVVDALLAAVHEAEGKTETAKGGGAAGGNSGASATEVSRATTAAPGGVPAGGATSNDALLRARSWLQTVRTAVSSANRHSGDCRCLRCSLACEVVRLHEERCPECGRHEGIGICACPDEDPRIVGYPPSTPASSSPERPEREELGRAMHEAFGATNWRAVCSKEDWMRAAERLYDMGLKDGGAIDDNRRWLDALYEVSRAIDLGARSDPPEIAVPRGVREYVAKVDALARERDEAAGALLVNIDEMPPGSTLGKVVSANSLLRQENGRLLARAITAERERDTALARVRELESLMSSGNTEALIERAAEVMRERAKKLVMDAAERASKEIHGHEPSTWSAMMALVVAVGALPIRAGREEKERTNG